MRFTPRKLHLLLGCAIALAATLAPAEPAFATSPPTNITVAFNDSDATISWTMAPGIEGYAITIREVGGHRSYGPEQVLGDRWDAAYSYFPGYGKWKKGYRFQVCSIVGSDTKAACTSMLDGFYVRSAGQAVSTSDIHRAAHKASSCLASGEEAGVVTAAGFGSVAALAAWIPGVGEVTAGGVAAAAASSGATEFVACLVGW